MVIKVCLSKILTIAESSGLSRIYMYSTCIIFLPFIFGMYRCLNALCYENLTFISARQLCHGGGMEMIWYPSFYSMLYPNASSCSAKMHFRWMDSNIRTFAPLSLSLFRFLHEHYLQNPGGVPLQMRLTPLSTISKCASRSKDQPKECVDWNIILLDFGLCSQRMYAFSRSLWQKRFKMAIVNKLTDVRFAYQEFVRCTSKFPLSEKGNEDYLTNLYKTKKVLRQLMIKVSDKRQFYLFCERGPCSFWAKHETHSA